MRGPREVFEDHLRLARTADVEADLKQNFSLEVQALTRWGVFRGHDGIRSLAAQLEQELPHAHFDYTTKLVAGEMAFLEWTGNGGGRRVEDGADSFLIRDGKVQTMTIHYTVLDERGVPWNGPSPQ